jgi:hypothetical protein
MTAINVFFHFFPMRYFQTFHYEKQRHQEQARERNKGGNTRLPAFFFFVFFKELIIVQFAVSFSLQ